MVTTQETRATPPSSHRSRPASPASADEPSLGSRALTLLSESWRPVAVLLALFVAWWFVAWRELVPAYLVPSPGAVAETMVADWAILLEHTWVTTLETIVGFVLAAVIGVATAVLLVYSRTAEKSLYPLILFAQVIPKIAIAPILVVWFGFGMTPKIVLAVLIAFFPVVISAVAGLRSVDPELLEMSATMGASRWKTFRKIRFPGALPQLMSGLKVAVTLAVVGAVVGEFVGADRGLGYVLLLASGNLDAPLLFADLILMSLIGVVLFVLVEVLERLLIPWHASRRGNVALAAL
ncbi:ABC transporter permease [Promicromonospora iranensis]|uniref:NitT/TauT family transport system permease protein n=1 Tax=Promicromonospora iranensis TaxID=1105144 RepID=A0ABU2CUR2_9MICO|nr:ABC transporter permease [Promicromonospora iranensis]MDR7385085.1 NitT/TauT family transport system permease protein [Promicromonospora iranensis]